MPVVTIKAHYNGQSIQLDEPFKLLPQAQLLVTVLTPSLSEYDESNTWTSLGINSLSRAYGSQEPEYSEADLKA